MAKLIDSQTINKVVPKIIETPDRFVINGQVYDKSTLEPLQFQTLPFPSEHTYAQMNTRCSPNIKRSTGYYDDNNIIIDKYNPECSYVLYAENNGYIRCCKLITKDNSIEKVYETLYSNTGNATLQTFSQDVNFIYGQYIMGAYDTYIFKINKSTGAFALCSLGSTYSQATLIKDTTLFIYVAVSRFNDRFSIIKYNKNSNSISTIYADNGVNAASYYTFSTPVAINENEILAIRCNKTFNANGIDNLILKKYLIDYNYDKVYAKNISLDCSILPKGMIMRFEDSTSINFTNLFTVNDNVYFTIYHRTEKKLYLVKRISDANYSIVQQYDLPINYNGVLPYNDGKTLIFYYNTFIDFMSFRELEEKFERTSSISGNFVSLCVDKNKLIWLQHSDNSLEVIGLNVPTICEALFVDTDLSYVNEDIESKLEVFCKNFDGKLIETDVEVYLNGPVYFTDSGSKKRKIRTSANNVIRVPITIDNSGYIEANTTIL